jgi:Laminin G domain
MFTFSLCYFELVLPAWSQVNGQLVAHYDMGDSEQWITENRKRVDDGRYHYVTFIRNHSDVTLQVDSMPIRRKQHGIYFKYCILVNGRLTFSVYLNQK